MTRRRRWSPPARLKQPIRSVLSRFGFEVVRLRRPDTVYLQHLISERGVNLILDVGANQGQYALHMRALGYSGRIASFEPGLEAFGLLSKHARRDSHWQVRRLAVGATRGLERLNVSRDSVSSSLLKVAPSLVLAAPASVIAYTEDVVLCPLDEAIEPQDSDVAWLKIDTQGSEDKVLAGAVRWLRRITVVQTEISLLPCYEGQADYRSLLEVLHASGFRLGLVEPGTQDPVSGEMLQFDGIFLRELDQSATKDGRHP